MIPLILAVFFITFEKNRTEIYHIHSQNDIIKLDEKSALMWTSRSERRRLLFLGRQKQTMRKNYQIIDSYDSPNTKIEILQLNQSENSVSSSHGQLKQVRIKLNRGMIKTRPGTLHMLQGSIGKKDNGIFRKIISRSLNATFYGTGEIYLEPSSCHYVLHKLDEEEILIEEEMFVCCEHTINVNPAKITASSSHLTKLKGSGICVLQSPVPESQIIKFELFDEQFKINHNCVILRSSSLQHAQTASFKTFLQSFSFFHDNQCLQTFQGTGKLWIVPVRLLN